jgi:hypothetical protein
VEDASLFIACWERAQNPPEQGVRKAHAASIEGTILAKTLERGLQAGFIQVGKASTLGVGLYTDTASIRSTSQPVDSVFAGSHSVLPNGSYRLRVLSRTAHLNKQHGLPQVPFIKAPPPVAVDPQELISVAAPLVQSTGQWGRWRPINEQAEMPSGIGCSVFDLTGVEVDFREHGDSWPGFAAARERGWQMFHAAGKHAAGRELDGRTWDEYPREAAR